MTKEQRERALKALEEIASIALSHVETEEDEDMDGEWTYDTVEVYDGTVGEAYPEAVKAIREALLAEEEG